MINYKQITGREALEQFLIALQANSTGKMPFFAKRSSAQYADHFILYQNGDRKTVYRIRIDMDKKQIKNVYFCDPYLGLAHTDRDIFNKFVAATNVVDVTRLFLNPHNFSQRPPVVQDEVAGIELAAQQFDAYDCGKLPVTALRF